jgi:hypothetical protein
VRPSERAPICGDPDYDRREPGTLQPQREYNQKNRCADLRKENHQLNHMFSQPNVSAVRKDLIEHDEATVLIPVCMSALIFMGDFGRDRCHRMQSRRTVRYMQILQRPYLQGFTLSR